MAPRFRAPPIPDAVLDALRLRAAMAAEQVLEEHVQSAVEVVEQGLKHAPIERLIGVYARLHQLSRQDAEKLRLRVLAALGRSGDPGGVLEGPRSPLARLARRLRGRVHAELRDWVERQTARVELAVADLHVEHALDAVDRLEGHLPAGPAIAFYTDLLELGSPMAELVRLQALRALHDRDSEEARGGRDDGTIPYPVRRAENEG